MRTTKYIVIFLSCIFLSQQVSSYAQADETGKISAAIAPEVESSLELLKTNDYEAALSKIDKTLQNPGLTPYEKSILFQLKGGAHYELNQHQETIQAFEDAINSGGLLENDTRQLRANIAQLWIAKGEYQRGAEMLEQWGRAGNTLNSTHIEVVMDAYLRSENYELALIWAERWFQDASPKVGKHYDLLHFLYSKLGRTEKQIEIVKMMTERWPDDKTLSDALASIYASSGRERDAFDVTRKYYLTGNPHSESEILRIVKYHSYYDMPYESARILDKEMETGRVSNTLKNKVWLSTLYQDAGHTNYAELFFAEAVKMSDQETAESLRKTLATPQHPSIAPDFIIRDLYPDFVPPKIDRRPFKIAISDRDAQPVVRIPPVVPKNAVKSGHCRLRFNVDRLGQPENVVARFCTETLFERAAIESVEKWKFQPKIVDSRQIARSGVEATVKFLVSDAKGMLIPE